MSSTHIATTYAQCLYQIAAQKAILTQVYKDICLVDDLYKIHPNLPLFLKNPILKPAKKQQVLQRTLQPYLHVQTLDFLLFVIKKKRYNSLLAIIQAFIAQYKKYKKIQPAHITTAQKLTPAHKANITALTAKIANCDTIELVEHTDPTLLGGYVLQIGDRQIDASLRTKLQRLKYFWTKN